MRTAVLLAVFAPLVAAAPVPKGTETERIEKLFGKPVDPDKDCKFALDGDKLVVTIPDTPHMLTEGEGRRANAPRVLREVKGDFVARVKVVCRPPPEPTGDAPFTPHAAGLIVYKDDASYTCLEAKRFRREWPGFALSRVVVRGRAGGSSGAEDGKVHMARPVWLEMTRRGYRYEYAVSLDGVTWNRKMSHDGTGIEHNLKVGVIAGHKPMIVQGQDGTAGFTATFEDFTVEPLTDPKK